MSSNGKPREQPPVVSKIGHMQGGFIEGTVNREQLAKFGTSSPSTRSSQQVSAALSLMENVSSKRDITGKIDRAKFRGLEGGKVELPPNASTAPDLNPSPDARARGGLKHKAVVPGSSSPAAGNREASGVDAAAPSGCCIVS